MNIINTPFDGLFILETLNYQDNRGCFQKIFNYDYFKDHGLDTDFQEFLYHKRKLFVVCIFNYRLVNIQNWFM